jgi:hypothetical protein
MTWAKDVVARGYADVHFFLGRHPDPFIADDASEVAPDTTWFRDVDDSYYGIPAKVQAMCSWAHRHGYDWLAKVDDDVYVVPERLPYVPFGCADYIGRFRSPYGKVYPVHFASGFTYWLSNHAMRIVAETPLNGDWMDERFVATALARRRIWGYNDPINYVVSGPYTSGKELRGRPLGRGTFFCEYPHPDQMREMHETFRDAEPVFDHPGLRLQPMVEVTEEILRSAPGDKIPVHKVERYMR